MKLRFPAFVSLPLLISVAALASAQTLEPPPIRMGLWQTDSTTAVEGATDSPMAQAMSQGNRTNVSQGCLTPETWKDQFQHMQQKMHDTECQVSNFEQDSHHVSFNESCAAHQGYSSNIRFEMLIDDTENAHGHADVKMTGPAFPQGMTMHMNVRTKFLSSNCGDVKPGEGKVIH